LFKRRGLSSGRRLACWICAPTVEKLLQVLGRRKKGRKEGKKRRLDLLGEIGRYTTNKHEAADMERNTSINILLIYW
jgi:hypothetical protein